MNKYTALITGGTGFVGNRIVKKLVADGVNVNIVTTRKTEFDRKFDQVKNVKWFSYSDNDLRNAVRDVSCFYHFAVAYDREGVSDEIIEFVNVDLAQKIMRLLQVNNQFVTCIFGDTFFRKFPAMSTKQSRYTKSKEKFAEWLLINQSDSDRNIRSALLQIEQVYGPDDSFSKVLPLITRQLLTNIPRLALTHGNQQRDFVHVDDVASAALTVANANWEGVVVVECGTGISTSVKEVIESICILSKSQTVLGFGDISPDQTIEKSHADLRWLNNHGWTPKVSLPTGLLELVQNVVHRIKCPN